MMRPMPPPPKAPTDIPGDWPALWQALLEARSLGAGWPSAQESCERSAALLALYTPMLEAHRAGTPWAVAQLGQSLDGFVATSTGDSYYVNGPHGLLHLHRLRALCDAVLVGAGTVATDNPQLTTRRVPGPNPVRVVLDPAGRLDGGARMLRDGQAPSLWLCDAQHVERARERLGPSEGPHPAEVLAVEGLIDGVEDGPGYHPQRAIQALAERGLRVLFVEGGGTTVSRFFRAGALDRLHLVVAPVLIGQGRRGLCAPAHAVMADCARPPARTVALGEDVLWELDLAAQRGVC